ncbi:MAG TPA: hypothetical protein VJQ44_18235 [Gemmatimonadales bacterium]|nr:hypothetical protein [Gemmatimonadales bacterium]
MTANLSVAGTRQGARRFYVGMAIAVIITVFLGFSRTYFLKSYFGTPALSLLVHIHGLVFTSWVLLFLAQTTLVATDRIDLHRKLGVGGAVLAALLLIVGTTTAIVRVAGGGPSPIPGVPPLSFLAVPLFDMVAFAILIGAGLVLRNRPETHKRLMTLATIALTSAPIARLSFVRPAGPPAFFGLTDLFIVAMLVHDFATRRKAHPATIWGGLLIVASQPLRLMISGTPEWLAFAGWLTGR